MPTELEELVGFLGAPQAHIRRIALENLVGYSASQPGIFKVDNLKPVKDLMKLVGESPLIAQQSLSILVNLSSDLSVVTLLLSSPSFLELLFKHITNPTFAGADYVAMLLANMAKHDKFPKMMLETKRKKPESKEVSESEMVLDQLMDLFVRGPGKAGVNKQADFDYLAYVFADVSRTPEGRKYFTTRQAYDDVIPISKLIVFTEHESELRRRGVACTIKNSCFDLPRHRTLLSTSEINLLPYILLPLMGPESYSDDETLIFPDELQFLPPTKKRDPCADILKTHAESLMLLTTTKFGREFMRKEVGVYPVLREAHLAVEDEPFREVVERLVQVVMAEEGEEEKEKGLEKEVEGKVEEDEDDKVVEIL